MLFLSWTQAQLDGKLATAAPNSRALWYKPSTWLDGWNENNDSKVLSPPSLVLMSGLSLMRGRRRSFGIYGQQPTSCHQCISAHCEGAARELLTWHGAAGNDAFVLCLQAELTGVVPIAAWLVDAYMALAQVQSRLERPLEAWTTLTQALSVLQNPALVQALDSLPSSSSVVR